LQHELPKPPISSRLCCPHGPSNPVLRASALADSGNEREENFSFVSHQKTNVFLEVLSLSFSINVLLGQPLLAFCMEEEKEPCSAFVFGYPRGQTDTCGQTVDLPPPFRLKTRLSIHQPVYRYINKGHASRIPFVGIHAHSADRWKGGQAEQWTHGGWEGAQQPSSCSRLDEIAGRGRGKRGGGNKVYEGEGALTARQISVE